MTEIIEGEIIETGAELVHVSAPLPISFVDNPEQFLEEAAAQAKVLKDFLVKTKSVMRIGQSEHVKVGGWQFLAQLAGLSVGTSAEPVTLDNGDTGWKARAILYRGGQQVGDADALCLRSEKNWANSDTYAICSMAQTRAISKAIKGVLGFVVVMAGYSDTPAEEMVGVGGKRRASTAKDKAPAMRKRIMELSVAADEARHSAKTAGEILASIKATWDVGSLDDLNESQLSILGTDLKEWVDGGCVGEFRVVPF